MMTNTMSSSMTSLQMGTKSRIVLGIFVLVFSAAFLVYNQFLQGVMVHLSAEIKAVKHLPKGFQPALNKTEVAQLYSILSTFDKAMRSANLTYMMCGGTLLGSYRHHGMIPWDDDADVYVLDSEKDKVKEVLLKLAPEFTMAYVPSRPRWKLFPSSNPHIAGLDWSFPFIDVGFMKISGNTISDVDWRFYKFSYDLSMVFPLVKRPFGNLKLFAPRDTEGVLKKNYDLDICQGNSHSHKLEKHIFVYKKVMCKELYHIYPFVHRVSNVKGTNETLRLGNEDLDWVYMPNES